MDVKSDFGLAFIIGAIAAIAVAPHIAVPLDIRIISLRFKLNNLPIINPHKKMERTNIEIEGMNDFVISNASSIGIEKASKIIPIWINIGPIFLVMKLTGKSTKYARIIPSNNDMNAEPINIETDTNIKAIKYDIKFCYLINM